MPTRASQTFASAARAASYDWAVFEAEVLHVQGTHSARPAPVHGALRSAHAMLHSQTLRRIHATPGAFDGERAVIAELRQQPQRLELITLHRTYSEGLALKQLLSSAQVRKTLNCPADLVPQPELSWGAALALVVLLPEQRVLAGQRASHLLVDPGQWCCAFTEVLEPGDVPGGNMRPVLDRLIAEELPAFAQLGTPRFVGLVRWRQTWGWSLVGVLDLRNEPAHAVRQALELLQPDDETQAWQSVDLREVPPELASNWTDLAQDLSRRLESA